MPTRLRRVFFGDGSAIHPMSQARFASSLPTRAKRSLNSVAGRRVRFLLLFVWFEDGVPIEVSRVEGSPVTLDDEGHRDLTDASAEQPSASSIRAIDPRPPG